MNPAAARDMYRRQMAAHGEAAILRRFNGANETDYPIRLKILSAKPAELSGHVQTMTRRALILAADLEAANVPLPLRPKQDRILWNGATHTIAEVDLASRRIGGTTIAAEIEMNGP
jgi:hypothetical protein